ncbi:hypothetical protein GCM10023195_40450 [Actinoallomurus liliacearum]|uniref:Uncharacterized protein n=1 Tax=Actinoallomurus liliacearum TaxID=1080073 RepID=A0ABP8TNQ5_9ACTN
MFVSNPFAPFIGIHVDAATGTGKGNRLRAGRPIRRGGIDTTDHVAFSSNERIGSLICYSEKTSLLRSVSNVPPTPPIM